MFKHMCSSLSVLNFQLKRSVIGTISFESRFAEPDSLA